MKESAPEKSVHNAVCCRQGCSRHRRRRVPECNCQRIHYTSPAWHSIWTTRSSNNRHHPEGRAGAKKPQRIIISEVHEDRQRLKCFWSAAVTAKKGEVAEQTRAKAGGMRRNSVCNCSKAGAADCGAVCQSENRHKRTQRLILHPPPQKLFEVSNTR